MRLVGHKGNWVNLYPGCGLAACRTREWQIGILEWLQGTCPLKAISTQEEWGSAGAKRAKQARSCHSQCPSVDAQVDCLIDLATDPNVLARQWVGLATWV